MFCPQCGYKRKENESAPEWQCPSCGVAYHKIIKAAPEEPINNVDEKINSPEGNNIGLDMKYLVSIAGVMILTIGVFCPLVSLPLGKYVTSFNGGEGFGVFHLVLVLFALYFIQKKKYRWVSVAGLIMLGINIYYFFNIYDGLEQLKAQMAHELKGNPFAGIVSLATEAMGLQWGWIVLFVGSIMITCAYSISDKRILLPIKTT